MKPLRFEKDLFGNSHYHADGRYRDLKTSDYLTALQEIILFKSQKGSSLNFHIPYEIQFKSHRNKFKGILFMNYVWLMGKVFGAKIYWENTCILNTLDWSFLEANSFIPERYDLTLDIGHLMLGSKTKDEAIERIKIFLKKHNKSIKHLHLHINNFVSDEHNNKKENINNFLGSELYSQLIKERSYIFEKGE
jgi:hypothetical protein